jgi:hypothetical protein
MQQLPGKRALALVAALALASAGSAFAQDTTQAGGARFDTTEAGAGAIDTAGADTAAQLDRDTSAVDDTSGVSDTTDTSGVQNPPGYRGMERDTTIFPPDSGQAATPGEVENQTTGTYEDSVAHDSMDHTGAGDTTGETPDSTQ